MSKKQSKKSMYILGLLMLGAFTLAFQLGAVSALAQDQDLDGWPDSLETSGFNLTTGMQMVTDTGALAGSVTNCQSGSIRQNCVDPATKDLFVIIQRATKPCPPSPTSCGDSCGPPLFGTSDIATPSQYQNIYGSPFGPLQWVSGLGVTTHELLQTSGTSWQVTQQPGGWYAVKIVEDLNPCSNGWMGQSFPGRITPTSNSFATVYPEYIMNWTDTACSLPPCFKDSKGNIIGCYAAKSVHSPLPAGYVYPSSGTTFTCQNYNKPTIDMNRTNPGPDLTTIYHDFIKNVISHEASHMINLAFSSGTSADHHWPAGTGTGPGTLMEQHIGTKATLGKTGNITVILYISTTYASQDTKQPGGYLLD